MQKYIILFFTILIFTGCMLNLSLADLETWMCGPYTLCQVAERYGKVFDPNVVAKLSKTTEQGTTMKGLADAAYQLGMKVVGQKTTYSNISQLTPPLIALVKVQDNIITNHFVVIDKIEANQIEIWDVNKGYEIYSKEKFESMWEGYVLLISLLPPQSQVSVDAPDIQIDTPIHDFGTLPQMEPVNHEFIIKNVGMLPLEILEVHPSCNCEKVELEEKVIPSGEQTKLNVSFQGTSNSGKTRVAVYLKTNDPDEPNVVVSMFGIINGVARVYPGHFNLGNITQEESIRKSFLIHSRSYGYELKVKSVKSSSPGIKPKLHKVKDKEILARVNFEIGKLPLGPFRETIIVTTNAEKYSEIHIGIEGTVIGELLLEPNQYFFGFLQVGKPVHRTVTVEKHGKPDLKILKVEENLSFVDIKIIPVEPGRKYKINAICAPTAASPKSIRDVVKIHTNSKKQPIVEIPVYGILQKHPLITNQER